VASAPPDQDEAAQEREVGRGVTGPSARLVFEPSGVAGIVIFVFDAPPGSDREQGVLWGERFTQDEAAAPNAVFPGGFFGAVAFDFAELGGVDKAEFFRGEVERTAVALVEAAVARFKGRGEKRGLSWASAASAYWAALG